MSVWSTWPAVSLCTAGTTECTYICIFLFYGEGGIACALQHLKSQVLQSTVHTAIKVQTLSGFPVKTMTQGI